MSQAEKSPQINMKKENLHDLHGDLTIITFELLLSVLLAAVLLFFRQNDQRVAFV